jgi:hypothetical protein
VSGTHYRVPRAGGPRRSFPQAFEQYGRLRELDPLVVQTRANMAWVERVVDELFGGDVAPDRARRWVEILLFVREKRITRRDKVVAALASCHDTTVSRDFHALGERGFLVDPNFLRQSHQQAWVALCESGEWRLREAILRAERMEQPVDWLRARRSARRESAQRRLRCHATSPALGPPKSNPPIIRKRAGVLPAWLPSSRALS